MDALRVRVGILKSEPRAEAETQVVTERASSVQKPECYATIMKGSVFVMWLLVFVSVSFMQRALDAVTVLLLYQSLSYEVTDYQTRLSLLPPSRSLSMSSS